MAGLASNYCGFTVFCPDEEMISQNYIFIIFTGYTPAHIAAQQEDLVAMKLLVHGKADINMADGKSGKTPLHHVVEVDELSIAAYLILQVIHSSI